MTHRLLFRSLLAIVLIAPLPLGGFRPWAWSALALAVGGLAGLWALGVWRGRISTPLGLARLAPVLIPAALPLFWALIQTISVIDASLWHPLWSETLRTLRLPVPAGISVDPEMTRVAVMRILTYGMVFILACELGRERALAQEALVALTGAGVVYAAYGLIAHFVDGEHILWLRKTAYLGDVTATFVNRNSYGAYAALGGLCGTALVLNAIKAGGGRRRTFRVAEALANQGLPALAACLIIVSAEILSHSRGATLAFGVALVTLVAAMVAAQQLSGRAALSIGAVMAATGLFVLTLSGDQLVSRMAETSVNGQDEVRVELFRVTGSAIADAPWVGYGLGTFKPAFRAYRDPTLTSDKVLDFAHNVYLEFAMDVGVPAALSYFAAFVVIAAACLRALRQRRRDHIYPALALAALVLIGVHSFVDFSAQMPAIAMTLALILGLGYGQSWRTSDLEA